jgi:hypothetical protein
MADKSIELQESRIYEVKNSRFDFILLRLPVSQNLLAINNIFLHLAFGRQSVLDKKTSSFELDKRNGINA